MIKKRQRNITLDRIEEISKLLQLSAREKQYFRDWISQLDPLEKSEVEDQDTKYPNRKRRYVSSHILKDWLNIYVKDAFDIPSIGSDPKKVFALLGGIASKDRIEKSIKFLSNEGHLRRLPNGALTTEVPLVVSDSKVKDKDIRAFHKAALRIAREAIDQYSLEERTANALVLALDEQGYKDLNRMIEDFSEKIQSFSERKVEKSSQLYQLIINLSPTGGQQG